ncbi:uncharacterized protein BJ171DRAFT_508506 [Polychytrium aggregatum]|uniref:uncharacterized protein n=1 Tax=Polychytrium aggregatum TaxID=110093 RepID=UPI0022FEA68E|nr:uncharacterized protein BJ171DRAFT_508506 [Polychytrium aggregatum]KAI9203879.1 hypothetical protein BJ171DRAFT_508506 [Polychytrium aggregatum]
MYGSPIRNERCRYLPASPPPAVASIRPGPGPGPGRRLGWLDCQHLSESESDSAGRLQRGQWSRIRNKPCKALAGSGWICKCLDETGVGDFKSRCEAWSPVSPSVAHQTSRPSDDFTTAMAMQGGSTEALSENERLIREVYGIEKRLVALLSVASQAINVLSKDQPMHDAKEVFERQVGSFLEILNEIQAGLRKHIRILSTQGILNSTGTTIPYRGTTAGHEKDLEILNDGIEMILERFRASIHRLGQLDLAPLPSAQRSWPLHRHHGGLGREGQESLDGMEVEQASEQEQLGIDF